MKMKRKVLGSGSRRCFRILITIVTTMLLVPGTGLLFANCASAQPSAQPAAQPAAREGTADPAASPVAPIPEAQEAARIPNDQLDSLVAPIALYPDPLLSQTLVASTYPLEIMQLQQWLGRNGNLTGKAQTDAVSKEPWDPSIQAMAALPDVVKRLSDDIQWTTDLGNAFLAQQADVMDAVQRMRQKAQGTGALQSNQQQRVETEVVQGKTVIVVEQSSPEVVYVPSYDPMYAYGAPVYPYPAIGYPAYVPGAALLSFGVGMAIGAAWGGGGWGWGCGWGGNDININRNNSFNRNTNINGGNRNQINGGNRWQHNPTHRGGAPYGDRNTANKFGGNARGDSLSNRQASAKQQVGRQGGNLSSSTRAGDRAGGAGASDRSRGGAGASAGTSDRSRTGGASGQPRSGGDRASAGATDRSRSGGASGQPRSSGVAGDRASKSSVSDRSSGAGSRGGGGADRAGSRDVGGSGGGKNSAFGGGSGGYSGSNARSSSSRGSSSMSSRGGGGGGGSRGGGGASRGGGGGGSRGGGGGGRRR